MVADEIVRWQRWLQELAERFDRFRPSLRLEGTTERADTVPIWEAATAHLLTTTVARIEDDDAWQGWCRRVLTWFLNAAGVPEQRSATLVEEAVDARFDNWVPLTAADVADIAERIARQVRQSANGGVPRAGQGGDDWPDTWPHAWPSWRATNLARSYS
ncbi:hypothetical protein [Micromonospora sp. CB01531]|uniref:hypothetical protein n=1 Tax=Micromonospora sp. CB01531 TaxID=1718947 RepID=UPI001F517485|nr:hypothetical protein [Micromonospora sp. CB01531]